MFQAGAASIGGANGPSSLLLGLAVCFRMLQATVRMHTFPGFAPCAAGLSSTSVTVPSIWPGIPFSLDLTEGRVDLE